MTGYLERLAMAGQERRTALPAAAYERLLACTRCGTLCRLFEAVHGARTPEEHQHIDAAEFVCWECGG